MSKFYTTFRFLLVGILTFVVTTAQAQTPWTTIVEEHFDALTDGTEDIPSTISLLDESGWVTDVADWARFDPSCTLGWGGHNLYSAGGAIAAMRGGFLNTPTGDYSGQLRMTCRLRLVKGQGLTNAPLDIILMRRSKFEDHKRVTVLLTEEWQDVTFTADNGWFEDDMIQFFTMDSFHYLIDDIVIEHQINSIPEPEIDYPTDISENGFTAHWMPSNGAESYLLNVYTKTPNPDVYESHTQGVLELAADAILTEHSTMPISAATLSFSIEDYGMPLEYQTKEKLNISALTDNGWREWLVVSVDAARLQPGKHVDLDLAKYIPIFGEIHQLRLTLDDWEGCTVIFDDITLQAAGAPIITYLRHEQPVGAVTSCRVEGRGYDPDADYWYSVRAMGATPDGQTDPLMSKTSDEQFVFTVSNPLTLPATGVTANSFTAHWQSGRKAEGFRIDCLNRYTAAADAPDYVVLDEDFSRVHSTGTVDAPEPGTPTTVYESIDHFTTVGGWTAASVQMAEGMLGGMAQQEGTIAGAISTPVIDLSHNNGICRVTVEAYGTPGDGIAIQGAAFNAFNIVQFDETGHVDATVEIPLCSSAESLTFYSYTYSPFLLDRIRIAQPLAAGDVVETTVHSQRIADANAREARVEGSNFATGELLYRVLAYRTDPTEYGGIEYFSQFPNTVSVALPDGVGSLPSASHLLLPSYDLSGRVHPEHQSKGRAVAPIVIVGGRKQMTR